VQALPACPICDAEQRTVVAEFNRFVVNDEAPSPGADRYDYAVCHGCGLMYATRRPDKPELAALLANFDDSLGRDPKPDPVLRIEPLDDESRAELRRRLGTGIFVFDRRAAGRRWVASRNAPGPPILRSSSRRAPHAGAA
jgi:hypothetical protein